MWIGIAAVAVVVIAIAVIVPLVLARGGAEVTETTTRPPSTTTSTVQAGTSTSSTRPTQPETTTTTLPPGPPGDSVGEWGEIAMPDVPGQVMSVAVCDDGLAMLTGTGSGYKIFIHDFASGTTLELPTGDGDVGGLDIDKNIAVWWEGTYDDTSGEYIDQHIYSYAYPDGPRVEVVGDDLNVGYPQIAGIWVTWVVGSPWETQPDEYWRMPIYGSFVSVGSDSANDPQSLVPTAIAPIMGDAIWTYSLGETYLAWEQGVEEGGLPMGSYVLDLMSPQAQPVYLGTEAWRPSVSLDKVAFWNGGIQLLNLATGELSDLDGRGDFPTAAPTFAAYFRAVEGGDTTSWEIVARGYKGAYEQSLGEQGDPPWFSPAIGASGRHVAFVADGQLHVFEWKAGDQKAR